MRTSGPRRLKTTDTATLLFELEGLLTEQLRLFGGEPYRQRLEIEAELSEVRRQLERLGFPPSK
jgi:hypothetical protein